MTIELDLGRTARYLGRGLRLRCPECGQGRMFRRWLTALPRCSSCGILFDRGQHDFFIGAYTVNLIIAELAVVAGLVIAILVTWPDVPWTPIKYSLAALAVLFPLVTYPFSKSIWLAIDLIYQPAQPGDFETSSGSNAA